MSTCLDDSAVLEMLSGLASPMAIVATERHLDGCTTCRELVATLAARLRAPDEDGELDWQATSGAELATPGSDIGRYTILEPVGSGASSVVYTAFDPNSIAAWR